MSLFIIYTQGGVEVVEHVHRPPLPRQDRPQARQLLPRQGKYEQMNMTWHGKIDVATNDIFNMRSLNFRSVVGQTCYNIRKESHVEFKLHCIGGCKYLLF